MPERTWRGSRAALCVVTLALACAFWTPSSGAAAPTHPERPDLLQEAQRACGVTTDPQGRLYVSEQTAKKVSVLAPDGSFITSFSTTADLPNNPCQIAVDSSGDVYVINSLRTQAIKYAPSVYPPTGATTYAPDLALNGNGRLALGGNSDVNSVAVDLATDNVYLAQDTGNEVQEYLNPTESYKLRCEGDETAATLGELSTTGEIKAALEAAPVECKTVTVAAGTPATRKRVTFSGVMASKDVPAIEVIKGGCTVEVNCEKAFEMFAGAATDHVTKFASSGAPIFKTIGAFIAGASYTGVDVYSKNGNVYLTDETNKKAYVLNNAGDTILAQFDGSDSLAGPFAFPALSLPDIAVDQTNGHAYVTDVAEHHVIDEFDGAGNFVSEISHDPAFEHAASSTVAVDGSATSPNQGVVYLTAFLAGESVLEAEVFAYGPLTFAFPLKVTKTGQGSGRVVSVPLGIDCGAICEAEFEADGLVKLSVEPAFGSALGAWSGCDAVTSEECEVTMGEAREVSVRLDSRPVVSEQVASQITASSARLDAQVNPKGKATTYHFEYITEEAWLANGGGFSGAEPAAKIPSEPQEIGSSTTAVPVTIKVEGLSPSTTYRFRVVATNAIGTAEGERDPTTDEEIERSFTTYSPPQVFAGECPANEALRTGPSASLPDCRAWEQASPVDKNGGSIQGTTLSSRTAEDGSTISFESTTGIPGGVGAQNFPTYMARRGPGGWSTTGLLPSPPAGQRAGVLGWSADFATAFSEAERLSEGTSLVARDTAGGSEAEIVPHTPPPNVPQYAYLGASADGEAVLFEAWPTDPATKSLQLTADAAAGEPNVYAWERGTGDLRLAGVLPDGSTPVEGSRVMSARDSLEYVRDTGFVTEDGSIFFYDRSDGQLYLRLNPTAEETSATDSEGDCVPDPVLACTVHISASQKENGKGPGGRDSAGPQPATLRAASPDGSVVTFTSSEKLTDDAHTGPEPDAPAIARAKASDGGDKDLEFIPAFAHEIAVDETGGYVYWSDPASGRIGRAKLDGTEFDEDYLLVPDIETDPGVFVPARPLGIAVIHEPGAEYIFWTDRGPLDEGSPQAGQGSIGRADLDGTDADPTCYPGLTNPRSIAARPDFIYWTTPDVSATFGEGNVGRAELGCNEPSTKTLIDNFASGDIAVDANHIYFSFTSNNVGFIRRYTLDGEGDADAPIVGMPGVQSPPSLTLDGTHLYWTNPVTQEIGRSDLAGTDASEEHSFISEAGRPGDLARGGEHLLWTANQGVAPNSGTDLYQLDRESGVLEDLAVDPGSTNGVEAQGVLGASEDGSYVYFAANGLPEGVGNSPNERGEEAEPGNCKGTGNAATGACNLYVAHGGEVDFITRLNASRHGNETASGDAINWIVDLREAGKRDTGKTARVSAEGGVLVFRSYRQLTAYENEGPRCAQANNLKDRIPGSCLEFYRFEYDEMHLACLTCDPRGTGPEGPAKLESVRAPDIGAPLPAATLSRNLSREGDRFFFETPDALVAQDANGAGGCPAWGRPEQEESSLTCQDVYEWEAAGTGSCSETSPAYSELNEGCIYLISTGKSPEATFFADADPDGDNVFIFTFEQLVGQDKDALLDAYDARVDGGLASQSSPPQPICSGDSCKAPPSTPAAPPPPGSANFSGPGDPAPKRAHKKKRKKRKQAKKKRKRAKQKQRAAKKSRGARR
jgi:virginiamycin B lyase